MLSQLESIRFTQQELLDRSIDRTYRLGVDITFQTCNLSSFKTQNTDIRRHDRDYITVHRL